ncbi:Diacylglycerol O-acyltransferase 2 [Trichinella nativa]|uniref:Acyltransferase n=1 Tax=Trichinella nativa TaxID=6335 RepID=A0A0V1LG19_9BILA|nr:Diacylglycerol O-acyltransferase 2 [Trichinella nativa]
MSWLFSQSADIGGSTMVESVSKARSANSMANWTMEILLLSFYVALFLCPYFVCCFIIYVVFFTRYWWLIALYTIWMVFDYSTSKRGSRPTHFIRKWKIWNYFRDYFPITLIKTADLDPDQNYIFGVHPHGVMAFSAFCNFCTEATNFSRLFPNLQIPRLCILAGQFWFPIRRELLLLAGMIDASQSSISWMLNKEEKGQVVAIIVGGSLESLDAVPGRNQLVLLRRKGFVRQAIQSGAWLVPVYSFGENDVYSQLEGRSQQSMLRKWQYTWYRFFGWPPALIYGQGFSENTFGIYPYRRPIRTVVGEPIPVQQCDQPDEQMVNHLHALYVEKLTELFERYKPSDDWKLSIQ